MLDLNSLGILEDFKTACLRKYERLCRAWRLLLDPGGVGRVPFGAFCNAARTIGQWDLPRIWSGLDVNQSGFITLDEWDPIAFRNLSEFRDICYREFGGMDAGFDFGMDHDSARKVDLRKVERFCERFDFAGDPRALFEALDVHRHTFIIKDDLEFLVRWQGERYPKRHRECGFELARLRLREEQHRHLMHNLLCVRRRQVVQQKLPAVYSATAGPPPPPAPPGAAAGEGGGLAAAEAGEEDEGGQQEEGRSGGAVTLPAGAFADPC